MTTTINPYNQTEIASYPTLTNKELEVTLTQCATAFKTWKNSSLDSREQLGLRLVEQLNRQENELAKLISIEMGKPIKESVREIEKCIQLVEYYLNHFRTFLTPKSLDTFTQIQHQSTGAVFGIMPWNFPFWQVFRYIIPNVFAGNICLLKHAQNTFGCGRAIEQLFIDAGFPKHVFTNLLINTSQTEQVIKHNIVQGVCVTGSTKAGSAVATLAGKYLKPSVLELGGIDAALILKDADFDKAISATINARLLNAGQICIAPKRVFVCKNKLEDAVTYCKNKIENTVLGNPLEPQTTMGPIAKADFIPTLKKQVQKAVEHGAELIAGGKDKSPFFEPTLLIMNTDNPMLQEEIFGPVICLISYDDEIDLIRLTNSAPYGLGAAIWSKDVERAKQLANNIEVGYVAINQIVKSDPRYPFGGVKDSGYGKELGEDGFKTFLNAKTIAVAN
ncbi:aldehyde dehydrogenase family protein [Wenyingzhuangia sp. IMCC45533]